MQIYNFNDLISSDLPFNLSFNVYIELIILKEFKFDKNISIYKYNLQIYNYLKNVIN